MNEINRTLPRPPRPLCRPEASRNADPRPEGLRAHCTAIEPPRKCSESMLLNRICQWRNMFRRAGRRRRVGPGGRSRRGRRSGTHSIYEIKRYVYESSRQRITAGTRKDSELRPKRRVIPERTAGPAPPVWVVNRLFNFRAVYHRRPGSNARGARRSPPLRAITLAGLIWTCVEAGHLEMMHRVHGHPVQHRRRRPRSACEGALGDPLPALSFSRRNGLIAAGSGSRRGRLRSGAPGSIPSTRGAVSPGALEPEWKLDESGRALRDSPGHELGKISERPQVCRGAVGSTDQVHLVPARGR